MHNHVNHKNPGNIESDVFFYRDEEGRIKKGFWQSEEDRELAEYVGVTYETKQDALTDCGH